MQFFHIYLRTNLGFDDLANQFRGFLNCATTNQKTSGQIEQLRYGLNFGGKYYLFETCGVELKIIKNAGEVLEEDYPQCAYYLMCNKLEAFTDDHFRQFIYFLSELLKLKGVQNIVKEL